MANAKQELLARLKDVSEWYNIPVDIRCASIRMEYHYEDDPKEILLKDGHTQEEYMEFLDKLDFEYDSGYGLQHLHGTVWFTEPNAWLDRGEYDGSEWWQFFKCPEIPDTLK